LFFQEVHEACFNAQIGKTKMKADGLVFVMYLQQR
jgi:hypothetical protein